MNNKHVLSALSALFVLATLSACGAGVIALPKTGQTTCSDAAGTSIACAGTGQDGALQTGVAEPSPRFTVGVGVTAACVTDNLTGLMWTRNADLLPPGGQTWQLAVDYANNLTLCGFSDWRLANRKELRSLVNYSLADNAARLNTLGFSNVLAGYYWSSSSCVGNAACAWLVSMGDGNVDVHSSAHGHNVWPVRAGQ